MKKLLSLLLALVMSFTLAFSVVGCKKNDQSASDSQSTTDTGSSSGSGSQEEKQDRKVDYVHVKVDIDVKEGVVTDKIDGDMYLKFTEKGVDLVAVTKIEADNPANNDTDELAETDAQVETRIVESEVYYIDGEVLTRTKSYEKGATEIPEWDDEKNYFGNLYELLDKIDELAPEIDVGNDTTKSMLAEVIPEVTAAVREIIASRGKVGELELESVDKSVNVKLIANALGTWLEANKDKTLLQVIANLTGANDAAALKANILKIFEENADGTPVTVAEIIDRIEAFVGTYGTPVSFKALCDALQLEAGIDTATAVNAVKEVLKSLTAGGDEIDAMFPAVTAGQTLYDYVYAMLETLNIDDLLALIDSGSEEPDTPEETLAEGDETETDPATEPITWKALGDQVVAMLEGTKLNEAIDSLLTTVGVEFDTETIITALNSVLNKADVSFKTVIDDLGYPTKVAADVVVKGNLAALGMEGQIDEAISAVLDIDYAESVPAAIANKFVTPTDTNYEAYFKYLDRTLTLKEMQDVRKNGLTIDIGAATGSYANWTVTIGCGALDIDEVTVIEKDGVRLAYLNENKTQLIITKEWFALLDADSTRDSWSIYLDSSIEVSGNISSSTEYLHFDKLVVAAEDDLLAA